MTVTFFFILAEQQTNACYKSIICGFVVQVAKLLIQLYMNPDENRDFLFDVNA